MKSPAFLFYSKDWIADTADWEPESKGVYIDLLAHQHVNGSLPSDMRKLARVARLSPDEFKRVWEDIKHKFDIDGDHVVNRRLNQVINENQIKALKNKINGCFAAKIRSLTISSKQLRELKNDFDFEMFTTYPDDKIKEMVYQWVDQEVNRMVDRMDNNIGDVNAKAKGDVISNKKRGGTGGEKSQVKKEIPTLSEFLEYAKENDKEFDLKKSSIEMKYKSWVENDWNTGRNEPIKNWKSTLLNTLPYLNANPKSTTNGRTSKITEPSSNAEHLNNSYPAGS
tara:strand:- start:2052 stop:2897 length:846 start_codon:yes stop_codon:yes gene_type:complete